MISLITAVSKNGVIGRRGELPWYLPVDLKHFASLTTGHTVLMGSRTYESIVSRLGKPLPNRKNIVLTHDRGYTAPGCIVVHSVEEALMESSRDGDVFVIGGESVYRSFLPHVDQLFITEIEATIDGDARFPEWNRNEWLLQKSIQHHKDEKNLFDFSFLTYVRRK